MGRFRTKEDDVAKISTSVYISNIPESVFVKDIFHALKQYGLVVDSFIPVKRDKYGKRFGFVRNKGNEHKAAYKNGDDVTKRNFHSIPSVNTKAEENSWRDKSYMDLSLALLVRVKEFASLANLKMAIGNEGFTDIIIKYMGGNFSQIINASSDFETEGRIAWVEIEGVPFTLWSGKTFSRIASKWGKFLDVDDQEDNCYHSKRICVYMKSGRSIKDEFNIIHRGKKYWICAVETAGWVPDFTKENDDDDHDVLNSSKDGSDILRSRDVGNFKTGFDTRYDSEEEAVQETFFKKEESVNRLDEEDKVDSHMDKSEDPFNIYPLLNKTKINDEGVNISDCSMQYPPGFTLPLEKDEACINEDVENKLHNNVEVNKDNSKNVKDAVSSRHGNSNIKEAENEASYLGHFKKSYCPRTNGSILGLLKEVVKVGQLNAIMLERFLSDHRPILLRENHYDYGPTPYRFFHHWIEMDGFCKLVEDTWKNNPYKNMKAKYKLDLEDVDRIIDSCHGTENEIRSRSDIILKLQHCEEIDSMEMAQKAKIKWAVDGDENTKFFNGMLNKKRNILSIRGVMVDGVWVDDPKAVKNEFFDHFSKRFCKPNECRVTLSMYFPNRLQSDQRSELEMEVTNEEIKKALWDCGTDKAPGPDGFTFGFFCKFWYLVDKEVFDAVMYFFTYEDIPKGCNSSFIALIPKISDANLVKDFRPISLTSSIYKIIAKILSNRIIKVLGGIVNEVQSAFVANRHILDDRLFLTSYFSGVRRKRNKLYFSKLILKKLTTRFDGIFLMRSFVSLALVISGRDGFNVACILREDLLSSTVVLRKSFNMVNVLSKKCINLMMYMKIKMGNGESTLLWEDSWHVGGILKDIFPRVYALETSKPINVGEKLAHPSISHSFRRMPRGGAEQSQFAEFNDIMQQVILTPISDRWVWTLNNSGEFFVASVRKLIDDIVCSSGDQVTRRIRYVPNKVNILAWKVMTNSLATKFNISKRGIDINSISREICGVGWKLLVICSSLAIWRSRLAV
nr:RNA-directed DNA polymerase, eukaryota [Tanacetum cinerariifolium]